MTMNVLLQQDEPAKAPQKPEINCNIFTQHCDIPDDEAMVLLNLSINDNNESEAGFDFEEVEFDNLNVEYNFLRDTLVTLG